MQLLFIDESGTPPSKEKIAQSPFFVLGGVIIPEEKWHVLNNAFNELKDKYKVKGEIKWRYFAPQKSESTTSLSHLITLEKENLRNQIYDLLNQYSLKIHCFACDVEKIYTHFGKARDGNDIYSITYMQLVENFDDYLKTFVSKTNGLVICDNRMPSDDKHLRENHALMLHAWSIYGSSASLIEGLLIAPSHLSLGIQLADMVNGAVYRKVTKNDNRYFERIEKLFIVEKNTERKQFKFASGINIL